MEKTHYKNIFLEIIFPSNQLYERRAVVVQRALRRYSLILHPASVPLLQRRLDAGGRGDPVGGAAHADAAAAVRGGGAEVGVADQQGDVAGQRLLEVAWEMDWSGKQ